MDAVAQQQHVQIGGARLHVRRWPGSGRDRLPIVLLHDSLGAVSLWRDFPAQLAQRSGHPVIAYDRLGFGQSDAHPGHLAPGFIAAEAQASLIPLLDHFAIDQAILFGHSVGGGMAIAAAAGFAQRVAALITESAQCLTEQLTLDGIRAAQRQFEDPAQLARLARYHGDTTRARWVLDAWIDNWLSPAFAHWSLDEELRGLRCPLLALHGECDEFGSAAQAQRIASLGRGECLMLPGCGHVPHREEAETVLAAVADFLHRRLT